VNKAAGRGDFGTAAGLNTSTLIGRANMSASNCTSGLRFGALVRVSTERQERQGESLRTQRASIERDVLAMDGKVVGWYGGQEHATPGWEHGEVDRLVRDATAGKFNAVVVAYADRWARDNAKSKEGLEALRNAGVRFYVGSAEMDLFDPNVRLTLGLHAEIGEFIALQQAKKSLENRIARAERGLPVSGMLPWGRTWSEEEGWGIDPRKQGLIKEVAGRYLAGESLLSLARKFDVEDNDLSLGNLHKVLTSRCGDTWEQRFRSKRLNIDVTVQTRVPRLLPEEVVEAIRRKAADNLTHKVGAPPKHDYLLSRFVRCAHCGASFHGQPDPKGRRLYYRHTYSGFLKKTCPDGAAMVRAEDLDAAVLRELFTMFGNPLAVQRAVEAATPDPDRVGELRRRLASLKGELGKVTASQERVVGAIADETITNAKARAKMAELDTRSVLLGEEIAALQSELADLPTEEQVRATAARVAKVFGGDEEKHYPNRRDMALGMGKNILNTRIERMTREDQRALVETVFAGRLGRERFGVYVQRVPGRERGWRQAWRFRLLGRLVVDFWGDTFTPVTGRSLGAWPASGKR
jgi:site-specific DNA recombinase